MLVTDLFAELLDMVVSPENEAAPLQGTTSAPPEDAFQYETDDEGVEEDFYGDEPLVILQRELRSADAEASDISPLQQLASVAAEQMRALGNF